MTDQPAGSLAGAEGGHGWIAEVSGYFREFAVDAGSRAPLYGALSARIADEPDIIALLAGAEAGQRRPVLLFAAVHDLVLAGGEPELARFYPSTAMSHPAMSRPKMSDPATGSASAGGDPWPAFARTCAARAETIAELCATRVTQTNEVGRCATLLPALDAVHRVCGPLALVDVGCSAGLNLLLDRYHYQYQPGGDVGPDHARVRLECGTRGAVPVPPALPAIAARLGLDRAPIDVGDAAAARWLEACVWPDQIDRFERLTAAIAEARMSPPELHRGDAVADLAPLVRRAAVAGHPVVLNSWVLTYLTSEERSAYLANLDALGTEFDLSWVVAESPVLVPEVPIPPAPGDAPSAATVLALIRWRDGRRSSERLGIAHPHGYWLHWGR